MPGFLPLARKGLSFLTNEVLTALPERWLTDKMIGAWQAHFPSANLTPKDTQKFSDVVAKLPPAQRFTVLIDFPQMFSKEQWDDLAGTVVGMKEESALTHLMDACTMDDKAAKAHLMRAFTLLPEKEYQAHKVNQKWEKFKKTLEGVGKQIQEEFGPQSGSTLAPGNSLSEAEARLARARAKARRDWGN